MNIDFSQVVTAEAKAEAEAKAAREALNRDARAYLASTDWYVIRYQETGEPIPAEVMAERALARGRVVADPDLVLR